MKKKETLEEKLRKLSVEDVPPEDLAVISLLIDTQKKVLEFFNQELLSIIDKRKQREAKK